MEAVLAEMPLALFTTLSSIGAGAFVALAVATFAVPFTSDQLKKIDKMTALPLLVILVSFISAFCHLANVMNAPQVFANIGHSPLSNEIAVGCVFTVAAIVYWALGVAGKLSGGARKGFAAVVAVLAVLYALFMGIAYMMNTIPSWDTPFAPVQMLGFALVGGVACASLVWGLAGVDAKELAPAKTILVVVSIAGAVLAIVGVAGQAVIASGMENPLTVGADLVAQALPLVVIGLAGVVLCAVCSIFALRGSKLTAVGAVALVLAVAGILCARLSFYIMAMSVGLYVF